MLPLISGNINRLNGALICARTVHTAKGNLCAQRARWMVFFLTMVVSPLVIPAGAQLPYDRTSFLNGFASDSLIWTTGGYNIASPVNYLGEAILLRGIRNPNVSKSLRYAQQLDAVAPAISAEGQHVLVGHSLGSLIARGLYVNRPETRPHISGIVTIAAPHQGTPLANNAAEAVRFFGDVQRRVNDGILAVQIESIVFVTLGYFLPQPVHSIFIDIAMFVLNSASDASISLGDLVNLPKVPALPDLSPDSGVVQNLNSHYDDASLPRANIYGTIPFKHAALRIVTSAQGKDWAFNGTVASFNQGLTAFNVCKYVGYATIVLSRQGRACAYARKVLKRIDERWVKYVNGSDAFGSPRYVPFDGIVPNERSHYPSPNALAYDIGIDGVNHQNIYNTKKGLDQVAEGMRRIGMVQTGSPPPPLPSVSISGPTEIRPGAVCTWYASVGDGTPPYSYGWTNDGMPVGNDYSYTGSKGAGSTGSSFLVRVLVTDAVGAQGAREITVSENSSADLCFE
jgi:pimeloyl-ACP methyl ester carboxylesterase